MAKIRINLAVEDPLSEELLKAVFFKEFDSRIQAKECYGKKGCGYLKKNIHGFNRAAAYHPWLVLTDLDTHECAPGLVQDWLPVPKNRDFIFRVAIREIESWVMADREAFTEYLGINRELVPLYPDEILDPKKELLSLASRSRNRQVRESIVGHDGGSSQGPDYNGRLGYFVWHRWRPGHARQCSPSFEGMLLSLGKLKALNRRS